MSAIDTAISSTPVPVPNKKGRVFVRNLSFKNISEEKITAKLAMMKSFQRLEFNFYVLKK